jgi:hypothetical protein
VLLGIDVRDRLDGLAVAGVVRIGKCLGIHVGRTGVFVLLSVRAKPGVKLECTKIAVSAEARGYSAKASDAKASDAKASKAPSKSSA